MPIYANQKTQDVKDKLINMGCKLYNKGEMFYSGCLLDIPQNFKIAKGLTKEQGVYRLRTIMSDGTILLEDNCGSQFYTTAKNLVVASCKKHKKNKQLANC